MRITNTLLRQHIGWHFERHWRIQGKVRVRDTGTEKKLAEKGINVHRAEELLRKKKTFERVEVIGHGITKIKFDQTHPDWHDETILTYKDSNVLLEGLPQAKIITKTVELREGLPEQLEIKDLPKEIHKKCKNIVLNAHILDAEQQKLPKIKDPARPAWNFPRIYGVTQNRVNKLLTSKLLQVLETHSDESIVNDRYLFNDLFFSFPFEKNGKLIQLQLKGDSLLTSKRPLQPITTENTDSFELPDIYPVKPIITLNEENIYQVEDIYPVNKNVTKHHPHTVFVHYNDEEVKNLYEKEVTEPQIFGRSLLKTFTVGATYARQEHGKDIKKLPQPVTVQCVHTNGKWFHFGVLQINTLDLNESGVKNVWYQTNRLPLFESCSYQGGKPVLLGYNGEVIKHLFAFYNI